MIEKEHILNILKDVKKAVKEKEIIKLKELSNKTIHSSSIDQDPENITLAVIIYSLSKIIERTNYSEYKNWRGFFEKFMEHIDNSISYLEKDDVVKFAEELEKIRTDVSELTGDLKKNIQDVFKKASINKASKIYEHGISMEKTSKLLGISLFELAEYAGQTGISDINLNITMPVKKRIKLAMDFFEK